LNALDFYILKNNQWVIVDPPFNWQELLLELSFENNSPASVINSTKLTWKAENAHFINEWVKGGLTGSVGIFEGIPLRIRVCGTQELVFDGIIDLTDSETVYTCDIIECKIRDNRMDMVSQLMDSISFAFLATPTVDGGAGIINPSPTFVGGDYIVIPYQRNDVPDGIAFFTTALAIYNVAEKTYSVANELVGLVTAATTTTALAQVGATILAVFQIIFYVIYLALMILVIIALLKCAFNYLVSPVLSKFGMLAITLFQRACQYFGIGFSSSIFNLPQFRQLVIMPAKNAWAVNQTFTRTIMNNLAGGGIVNQRMQYDDLYNWQNPDPNTGKSFAYGYYDGTCGDFIRAMEDVFNAKAKIILNNSGQPVLHFERWDYIYDLANYQLPQISDQTPFNSQGVFNSNGVSQSGFKTNASDIYSNYYVKYSLDDTDYNTYEYYEGTVCYCTNKPTIVNTRKNVTLQNLKEVNLKFAQAFRKDQNTATEQALIPLWQAASLLVNAVVSITSGINSVINFVTNIVGLPAQLPTTQNGGIQFMPNMPPWSNSGHLLLSDNTTGVPKMFVHGWGTNITNYFDFQQHNITGVTIHQNNKDFIGARALMKNFHFSNLPQTVYPGAPYSSQQAGTPYYNQWLIFENQDIPVCCEEYNLIKNNNIIKTYYGKNARVDSLQWNLFKGMGTIDYRVNIPYTKNLETTYVIDGVVTTTQL
jgi:hypothetical protein